uniref:Uncharacterized protein n=1 Tax=Chromera velia CCMP2878 TaxID=1169474 RepID=A0A0G4GC18_9ALVE|eukprot:Cvel_4489.t1-p1 / transcript=Cvel_4489.t1 / gene=Cvel_4489 / organism=Chromera_velia_CCMP2878 / gene_product=hypothetical protein / transcript_product=hypothetical protein / location=Cvel_scaffold196:79732-81927(-) / protein_length=485 / sequence_SO=supercontig / SO=protein_coding / is_pseudo=false
MSGSDPPKINWEKYESRWETLPGEEDNGRWQYRQRILVEGDRMVIIKRVETNAPMEYLSRGDTFNNPEERRRVSEGTFHDAGHLAPRWAGAAEDERNLSPQDRDDSNRAGGEWYRTEMELRDLVKDGYQVTGGVTEYALYEKDANGEYQYREIVREHDWKIARDGVEDDHWRNGDIYRTFTPNPFHGDDNGGGGGGGGSGGGNPESNGLFQEVLNKRFAFSEKLTSANLEEGAGSGGDDVRGGGDGGQGRGGGSGGGEGRGEGGGGDSGKGKGDPDAEFKATLASEGLIDSYKRDHAEANLRSYVTAGFAEGDIGGIAARRGRLEGLDGHVEILLSPQHIFALPLREGQEVVETRGLQQLLREVYHGLMERGQAAFFSLHFNANARLYPVLHPVWIRTLVGKVIGYLDYFMKGFLSGGVFTEEFIEHHWKGRVGSRKDLVQKGHLIDLRDYCEKRGINYMSLHERLHHAGAEEGDGGEMTYQGIF